MTVQSYQLKKKVSGCRLKRHYLIPWTATVTVALIPHPSPTIKPVSETHLEQFRQKRDKSTASDQRSDVRVQKADGGILVSLQSGVVGKSDMEMEVTSDGKVLVFCHNVWSELDKLKGAINMICSACCNLKDFSDVLP